MTLALHLHHFFVKICLFWRQTITINSLVNQALAIPIGKKLENCDHSIVCSMYVLMVVSSIEYVNQEKSHYEGLMTTKVLPAIKTAEAEYADLQQLRQVFVLLLALMAFFYFVELWLFLYGSSLRESVFCYS